MKQYNNVKCNFISFILSQFQSLKMMIDLGFGSDLEQDSTKKENTVKRLFILVTILLLIFSCAATLYPTPFVFFFFFFFSFFFSFFLVRPWSVVGRIVEAVGAVGGRGEPGGPGSRDRQIGKCSFETNTPRGAPDEFHTFTFLKLPSRFHTILYQH